MSLASRSLMRSKALLRPTASLPRAFAASRQASTSTGSTPDEEDYVVHESFGTPFWRNFFLLTIGGVVVYRFSGMISPHLPATSSDPDDQGDNRPFLTRYMESWYTPRDVLKERNLHHLDLVRQKAEDKLFMQTAERPPIQRMRFPQAFEMASPHGLVAGGQVDMSDVVPKRDD